MVSISNKSSTSRLATAVCSVFFSTPSAIPLIRSNQLKKGDVLAVARIAGIMAAKRTPDLIPLCHPIPITHVSIDLETIAAKEVAGQELPTPTVGADTSQSSDVALSGNSSVKAENDLEYGSVAISATVSCDGKTGVEMEALTAANVAALTVYDMCKAVDKGMRIDGLRVIRKEGGKSGLWVDGENVGESACRSSETPQVAV
jgi:cyclic pyranopterin phosphate synthase